MTAARPLPFRAAWLLALLLAGCAAAPPAVPPREVLDSAGCRAWYAALAWEVERHGVADAQAARVADHPELRVDRLLAALATAAAEGPAYATWLRRAGELAAEGWRIELANLPAEAYARVAAVSAGSAEEMLAGCGAWLLDATARDTHGRAALLATARVPDVYVDGLRWLGLYPLTRHLVMAGYGRWRDAVEALHALPPERLPVTGRLLRYAVPGPEAGSAATPWPRDALGYPLLDAAAQAALFAAHAPVWEIDTAGDDDRPGTPAWPPGGALPTVDTTRPAEFRLLSYTRVAGVLLPQLNYALWFPARTAAGPGDIYAGRFDGLLLRVTLDADGAPLLVDAIHHCGCYHMFFPGPRLRPRPAAELPGEGYHVPQPLPSPAAGARWVVRLQAGTHQLLRLYPDAAGPPPRPLAAAPYAALRSLPRGAGRRSLFGTDGLVPGSARAERWLLWPMGIPSAGAQRQWGHHATAFVGRRHFDDPGLVEAGFRVAPPAAR